MRSYTERPAACEYYKNDDDDDKRELELTK